MGLIGWELIWVFLFFLLLSFSFDFFFFGVMEDKNSVGRK